MNSKILLSFDIEDWFQVENLKQAIKREGWDGQKLRVVRNTQKLLNILDNYGIKATFFVLGWVAEKVPQLILEIHKLGHEIASHGYAHELIYNLTQKEFRKDIIKSKKILEDIIEDNIIGYRAPSFSITSWAIDILKEEKYTYDSSIFPTIFHDRYSKSAYKYLKNRSGIIELSKGFFEVSLASLNIFKQRIPWAGAGYFRIIPYFLYKRGVKKIIKDRGYFLFYFHAWEIDPLQPKIQNIKFNHKIRHYAGLNKSEDKLKKYLEDFSFTSISEYLRAQKYIY